MCIVSQLYVKCMIFILTLLPINYYKCQQLYDKVNPYAFPNIYTLYCIMKQISVLQFKNIQINMINLNVRG